MSHPSILNEAPMLFEPHVETVVRVPPPPIGRIVVHIARHPYTRDGVHYERTYCGLHLDRSETRAAIGALRETYCKRCTELRSKA